jgi:transposase
MCLDDRPVLEPNAAGIDVGAREMFVAVPPGRDENPVRVFATFTEDLEQLADWLSACGVTTVAMESTGSTGFRSTRCSSSGGSAHVWQTRGI